MLKGCASFSACCCQPQPQFIDIPNLRKVLLPYLPFSNQRCWIAIGRFFKEGDAEGGLYCHVLCYNQAARPNGIIGYSGLLIPILGQK
ncbi:hypothetical protein BT69DRAFT_1283311 [Atractiella rhizophila]|nr:hypothetical protein BT69DRAFT_1283311 [Atractiella rhizophila]